MVRGNANFGCPDAQGIHRTKFVNHGESRDQIAVTAQKAARELGHAEMALRAQAHDRHIGVRTRATVNPRLSTTVCA